MVTLTDQDLRALTYAAIRVRQGVPGASRWDEQGTYANIAKVRDRSYAEVNMAVTRAAADRDVENPGVIPSNGSHWQESAAVRSYIPHIVAPEHRCGICSKAREKCARERVADDDHAFEPATSKPPRINVAATVAALKAEVVPTAPPPPTRTLAERVAELPPDPVLEAVRATLREAETTKQGVGA